MFTKTKVVCLFFVGLILITTSVSADQPRADVLKQFTREEIVEIGNNVYNTKAENTCLKCHLAGQGEGWAGAADLRKPYKWNAFNALGGYEALTNDPETFYKNFYTVLEELIENGGIKFNQGFSKEYPGIVLDWSKTKKKQYDMMMWGTVQGPMKQKIKTIQTDLETKGKKLTDAEMKDLAIVAVLEYIKGLEEPHKKDDGTEYPKIHRPLQI